jgi:hypothetical protein
LDPAPDRPDRSYPEAHIPGEGGVDDPPSTSRPPIVPKGKTPEVTPRWARWHKIAAVATVGLVGAWILSPTSMPRPWIEAGERKRRRLAEAEARAEARAEERRARDRRGTRPLTRHVAEPAAEADEDQLLLESPELEELGEAALI